MPCGTPCTLPTAVPEEVQKTKLKESRVNRKVFREKIAGRGAVCRESETKIRKQFTAFDRTTGKHTVAPSFYATVVDIFLHNIGLVYRNYADKSH